MEFLFTHAADVASCWRQIGFWGGKAGEEMTQQNEDSPRMMVTYRNPSDILLKREEAY